MISSSILRAVSIAIVGAVYLICAASATGTLHLANNCNFPVWYHNCATGCDQAAPAAYTKVASGSGWDVPYVQANAMSIKVAVVDASGKPTGIGSGLTPINQFEINIGSTTDLADGQQKVFYDLSSMDGNPLAKYGFSMVPSVGASTLFPSCVVQHCAANQVPCCQQYHPSDTCANSDNHTKCCPASANMLATLCSG